uniref:DUF4875 domain-containing protein n=1 Tax=Candidatus Kentrum sp. MB TaxID=2138164 RepID=A0A451BFX2_9GAMM|nr:MAG: protein of unknown function (DUF4875) [Candidatus Kentron sp. MB]VFK77195.1 MAG: protein of unknown function (DUF4875) [Candidatus Kentron sp. MB]
MADDSRKIEKKVYVRAGFTESQRRKNLEKTSKEWVSKGWSIVKVFDGGLTKSSYLALEKQAGQENLESIGEKKSVGILLVVGIFFLPIVFSWFTLRKGHTKLAKIVSFSWLVFTIAISIFYDDPSISQKAKVVPNEAKQESSQGRAQSYEVIGAEDYSFPRRKRVRWQIVAPSAQSRDDRAFTAIQAAKDLLKKTEADQATVWLEINKELAGKGYGLAIVSFTPDGKGNSGQEMNSKIWEVEVASDEVNSEQVRIANAWYAHRAKFADNDGLTDEPKLKTYLANELGIPENQISLPWVMREKFTYNGGIYEIEGTRVPSDVKEPESFSKSKCQMDLRCWGDKHNITASVYCDDYVEKLAKYSHEWTDGMLEPKFSHFRWKDKSKDYITYIGDKIKFQNGFGAWQNE